MNVVVNKIYICKIITSFECTKRKKLKIIYKMHLIKFKVQNLKKYLIYIENFEYQNNI